MSRVVKAFVVDDSGVGRRALVGCLGGDQRIRVVGEAASGEEALRRIPIAAPDIVLMDIVMPGMNGLDATRELMHVAPTPVLIVSDLVGKSADLSFEALNAGALEIIGKPSKEQLADGAYVESLCRKVRLLSEIPMVTRHRPRAGRGDLRRCRRNRPTSSQVSLVCIGASTGGPPAVHSLLSRISVRPPWPILVVQHMAAGFIGGMAEWLAASTPLDVRLACHRTRPLPGVVHVAPDGGHLELCGDLLRISEAGLVAGHRPSVDALLASVASAGPAESTVAALLTGMGSDGARGLGMLREAGGWTIAQDEASSVVYGMPKAAVEKGAACEVLSLDEISLYLASLA